MAKPFRGSHDILRGGGGRGGQKDEATERVTGAYMELQLPHACIYPAPQAEPNSATHAVMCDHIELGHDSALSPRNNQYRVDFAKFKDKNNLSIMAWQVIILFQMTICCR